MSEASQLSWSNHKEKSRRKAEQKKMVLKSPQKKSFSRLLSVVSCCAACKIFSFFEVFTFLKLDYGVNHSKLVIFKNAYKWWMLKAPPLIPWASISRYFKIGPKEGRLILFKTDKVASNNFVMEM